MHNFATISPWIGRSSALRNITFRHNRELS